jgi:hypothetical protein
MTCHTIIKRTLTESGVSLVRAICTCGKKTGEFAYTTSAEEVPTKEAAATVLFMMHSEGNKSE